MNVRGTRVNLSRMAVIVWPVIMIQVYVATVIFMSRGLDGPMAHGAQEAIRRAEAMKHQANVMVAVLMAEVVVMAIGGYALAIKVKQSMTP